MARIVTGGFTTFNLGTHLDPMTADLYGIADYFRTPGYVGANWAAAIDGSGRFILGYSASVTVAGATTGLQNHGATINAASYSQVVWAAGSASGSRIIGGKSRSGVLGSHTSGVVQSGDNLLLLDGAGSDGTDFQTAGRVTIAVDGTPGAADMPGRVSILTTPDGAATPVERLRVDSAGHTSPGSDNAYSCGISARRWSVVYAATGAINTSDARDKTAVRGLTEPEIAAARDLAREIGAYRFLDAVSAKGDAAREHVGLTVQRAMEVMASHGLDPLRYGFICHDSWPESVEPAEWRERPTGMLDSDGNQLMERVLVRAERRIPAGDRYSFRPDELNLFLARGFEARVAALEAAAA